MKKEKMMVKRRLLVGCIALFFDAFAHELYNPQQSYPAGSCLPLTVKLISLNDEFQQGNALIKLSQTRVIHRGSRPVTALPQV
ncbi:hypothetical protein SY86_00795 [Erwinia tracheiphila]|uniref:Uncharacterized protein n=1 Tax=Erwinia tracheiphila TaxID=65700 RepID=A0A0M2KFD1_9GAMM|nr:hypothetical protein [Erwinia tracheiphila]EOS93973.1 hypothetical protein ETR_16031 [Erwinia tracheiphila PSU-1]KKF38095.1 hypothetical protein SY86_00795 [Erwinia tracheiphila]